MSAGLPSPVSGGERGRTSTWPYLRSKSELGGSPYVFHCEIILIDRMFKANGEQHTYNLLPSLDEFCRNHFQFMFLIEQFCLKSSQRTRNDRHKL